MKTAELLKEYEAELRRTLGPDRAISVKMDRRRVHVMTLRESPGNRYTLKQVRGAIENLKLRPTHAKHKQL